MIQQYTEAAADLRNLIREAHEVLQDLRAENTKAKNLVRDYEARALSDAAKRTKDAEEELWRNFKEDVMPNFLDALGKVTDKIRDSTEDRVGLIADSALTLSLAIKKQDADSALNVAKILRKSIRAKDPT